MRMPIVLGLLLLVLPVAGVRAEEPLQAGFGHAVIDCRTTKCLDLDLFIQAGPTIEFRADPEERARISRFYAYDAETQRIMLRSYDESLWWSRFEQLMEELARTAPSALDAALRASRGTLRFQDGRVFGVRP